jgi:hypothetical protein
VSSTQIAIILAVAGLILTVVVGLAGIIVSILVAH